MEYNLIELIGNKVHIFTLTLMARLRTHARTHTHSSMYKSAVSVKKIKQKDSFSLGIRVAEPWGLHDHIMIH
jgi:hypothetical protein